MKHAVNKVKEMILIGQMYEPLHLGLHLTCSSSCEHLLHLGEEASLFLLGVGGLGPRTGRSGAPCRTQTRAACLTSREPCSRQEALAPPAGHRAHCV